MYKKIKFSVRTCLILYILYYKPADLGQKAIKHIFYHEEKSNVSAAIASARCATYN